MSSLAKIIQLSISWPPNFPPLYVDGGDEGGDGLYFILSQVGISPDPPSADEDYLGFKWTDTAPLMENCCHEHICLINGQILRPDNVATLQSGVTIQVGMFIFTVTIHDQDDSLLSAEFLNEHESLPELDDFISYGGHFIPWVDSAAHQDDVLKNLAYEYKHFLLWGRDIQRNYESEVHKENYLPERDEYLDGVTDNVKDKTITECILDNDNLINLVIDELMLINQVEDTDESVPDLLTMLAPENMAKIEKHLLPELLYRELYKLGLDSHL